ncbi:unnamed protein product, partial [Polarella glacialis]
PGMLGQGSSSMDEGSLSSSRSRPDSPGLAPLLSLGLVTTVAYVSQWIGRRALPSNMRSASLCALRASASDDVE